MQFIGIDPGKAGGIASMLFDGSEVHTWKMPETVKDLAGLFTQLSTHSAYPRENNDIWHTIVCCMEIVASRPGQSVRSMFTFGQHYGQLEMAVVSHGLRLERVRPQEWQKTFQLITGKEVTKTKKKNKHKARAQELWPDITVTHALADALLICEWCRQQNMKPPPAKPATNHHTGRSMSREQVRKRHARIMEGKE